MLRYRFQRNLTSASWTGRPQAYEVKWTNNRPGHVNRSQLISDIEHALSAILIPATGGSKADKVQDLPATFTVCGRLGLAGGQSSVPKPVGI